jgi:UDP-glucose 4-epimerase
LKNNKTINIKKGVIAITGSSGFVGSKLLLALANHNLRLLVRSIDNKINYEQIECDFETNNIPDDFFFGVSVVFHLAGIAHDIRDASDIEHIYRRVNVDSTLRLAKLAVRSGVKKFVFVSSVKAGGSSLSKKCISETEQEKPEGIYGETKREAELKLLALGRESGMHISIIRPSLVYGPDFKGNLALMFSGIKKGWFPPLPETGNKISMIHVDDLVRAIFLVAEDERANGEIFIVTDGIPHSSREIYNAMCSMIGKPIPKWSVPKLLFDIATLINSNIKYKIDKLLGDECYSSEKLEKLGYSPKRTLSEMNETFF